MSDVQTSEFYARLVAEHSRDSIMVMDAGGIIQWVNAGCLRVTGMSRDEMTGKRPDDLFGRRATSISAAELFQRTIETRRTVTVERNNARADGTDYWLETSASPVFGEGGEITHIVTVARDITERRRLEQESAAITASESARREERHLLSRMSEWLYAVKSFEELLEVVGASMEALFPGAEGQLYIYSNSRDTLDLAKGWGGGCCDDHIDPDDCWALRRGRAYSYGSAPIQFTCSHVHRDGGACDEPYFCLPIIAHGNTIGLLHLSRPGPGAACGAAGREVEAMWELALLCAEQISLAVANVRLRQELQDKSVRDPLTGLWNRRWFLDAATRALDEALRKETPLALVSLDVDRFKRFNDNHGHAAGDAVLRQVGQVLSDLGGGVSACRIGGEEFVILCPQMAEGEAADLADRLRVDLSGRELTSGGEPLPPVTISAGVAELMPGHPRGADVSALMKAADVALYAAKAAGRDRVMRSSLGGARAVSG